MRNFASKLCAIYISVLVAALTACTPDIDSTLGGEYTPENQSMSMRHLKFQGNTILEYDYNTGKNKPPRNAANLIESRMYRTDSVISHNLGDGYFGVRRSDIYGTRSAGFASSIIYMNELDDEYGWGYKPIFDTMKLLLTINDYKGDTLVPIKYNIYELKQSLVGSALSAEDSTAFINCDLSAIYDEQKPIFSFTFPVAERGEGPSTTIITLDPVKGSDGKMSAQTWDYIRRLMLIPEDYATNPDWDGYGREGLELYEDEDDWREAFPGLYIKPDVSSTVGKEGAMYATSLEASGLMLKGRNRNPLDPTQIKDTVGMYYYFFDEFTDLNLSVNKVERDYTQGLAKTPELNGKVMDETKTTEERDLASICHIEGMGGSMAEITFTDAMLDELTALLSNESGEYSKLGINQCLMTIYLKEASYDWSATQGNAAALTPLLDLAFDRLGTYQIYQPLNNDSKNPCSIRPLSPIIDYDYVTEEQYETELVYNGYLDRSRGCYILNITGHMQRLFRYVNETAKQKEDDGSYSYKFNKEDDNYVPRTIYIGTKATDPLDFSTVSLQGMADQDNKAPIQIDLTYTLVK